MQPEVCLRSQSHSNPADKLLSEAAYIYLIELWSRREPPYIFHTAEHVEVPL